MGNFPCYKYIVGGYIVNKFSLSFLLSCSLIASPCFSQSLESTEEDVLRTSIRDIGIIGGTTLLGVLIGASTLSFVDEPKDHLDRVLLGGSFGVILGVGIVIYFQATKSQELYNQQSSVPSINRSLENLRPNNGPLFARTNIPPPFIQHRFTF